MKKDITGMMVYYYFVCHRKLWYFCHEINMEQENENVLIGKALDETTYTREDKHIAIDQVINIDYLKDQHVLHEVKKSKAVEEASIWQLKYYLYYLKQRGVCHLHGKIDYPLLRKNVVVELSETDEKELDHICQEIRKIVQDPISVLPGKRSICKKCAYFDLCYV